MDIMPHVVPILGMSLVTATPILYAALGEILLERTGMINLGLEGLMLIGAVTSFLMTLKSGALWYGLLFGMLSGGVLAFIYAIITISLKGNQIVSGIAITMLGSGVSTYIGLSVVGTPGTVVFEKSAIPLLSKIPVIGPIFFNQDILVYVCLLLVPLLWWFLYKSKLGLEFRSVGENPAAADALGINVTLVRYVSVIAGGILTSLGGVYLTLAYNPFWLEDLSAGRGWIALALVPFSIWNPFRAAMGAYIFGLIFILGYRLQALGVGISPFFLQMLPYVFVILMLIWISRGSFKKRIRPPEALALTYFREER